MTRMRFPAVALPSALLASAALAALTFAAPATAQAVPGASTAKINDIQVSRDGDNVSILVKLSQQPSAASAKSSDTGLVLEVDGLQLTALNLTPPAGSLVTGVAANSNKVTLTGAALGNATTVIYRNAVLIEAKLAEPAVHGASLLAATAGSVLRFKTDDALPPALAARARVTGRIAQVAAHDAGEVERVLADLRAAGVRIEDLEIGRADLEDVFLHIMQGAQAPAVAEEAA